MSLATATESRISSLIPTKAGVSKRPACDLCAARKSGMCDAMPVAQLGRVTSISSLLQISAGSTFVNEGEEASQVFNVVSGAVKIYKLLPDGRRQITGILCTGDHLGLAFNENYSYSAESLTPVTICRFKRTQLEGLLDDFPKVEKRLMAMASNELAAAQDQMVLLGRKTARERVASFLLSLVRRAERNGDEVESIELPMTRTDIADFLGLTTETASRVFTSLKRDGVISFVWDCWV